MQAAGPLDDFDQIGAYHTSDKPKKSMRRKKKKKPIEYEKSSESSQSPKNMDIMYPAKISGADDSTFEQPYYLGKTMNNMKYDQPQVVNYNSPLTNKPSFDLSTNLNNNNDSFSNLPLIQEYQQPQNYKDLAKTRGIKKPNFNNVKKAEPK